jgi:NTP pyrophosphatase (non-canonical NTP hydrolase)
MVMEQKLSQELRMSPTMHIREYQAWLEAWDRARTWDRILPSHTLLHALEELGEISKLVQMVEGYRDPQEKDLAAIRDELALELSDLQVMLFKIAYLCGIDMEDAMQRGQVKADQRFPDPADGPAGQEAYWQRFQAYLANAGLKSAEYETKLGGPEVKNRQTIDPSLSD